MGNCNFKSDELDPTVGIATSHFEFLHVIGKGGFGKVWRVSHRKTKDGYAMKEMAKCRVIAKRSVNSVMNERKLLTSLRHSFQDRDNLYLVMDLMGGGDLRYHLSRVRRFSEHQTRFFVACILTGL
jgi:protein kinase A